LLNRYQEGEKRADWRAYFAGIAPRLEKPPKISEAFPLLAGSAGGGGWKREDFPPDWDITLGSEGEGQVKALLTAGQLMRRGAKRVQNGH